MKSSADRSIDIKHDAVGNAIITGNGNIVIIKTSHELAVPLEAGTAEPIAPNPYVGLAAFGEEDADRFFGREEQIRLLWERFRQLHLARPGPEPTLRLLKERFAAARW
jgi:hypothetical protein